VNGLDSNDCCHAVRRLPLLQQVHIVRNFLLDTSEVNVFQQFAKLSTPPYYAVIFSSLRTPEDRGYGAMADRMLELATQQPGYLGAESARDPAGFGITVSYWLSMESISDWKANAEHKIAQESGRRDWYAHYELRIARVERAYSK
jgi:heme-degrading monooxygenase HmoA